jgi:hypothetical protein
MNWLYRVDAIWIEFMKHGREDGLLTLSLDEEETMRTAF